MVIGSIQKFLKYSFKISVFHQPGGPTSVGHVTLKAFDPYSLL